MVPMCSPQARPRRSRKKDVFEVKDDGARVALRAETTALEMGHVRDLTSNSVATHCSACTEVFWEFLKRRCESLSAFASAIYPQPDG